MICPYCGKENAENLDRCEYCGGPLTVVSPELIDETNPLEPNYTVVNNPPAEAEVLPPSTEPEVLPPAPAQFTPIPPQRARGNRIWWLVGCVVIVLLFLCCGVGLLTLFRVAGRISSNPLPTILPAIALNLSPTIAPAIDQNLLFFDDFSDPNSGWDTVDTADYYADYYQGAYRIMVNTNMSDSWANPDSNVFSDVRVEAEAKKNSGPDDNDFGLICRYVNSNEFYYGVISSDGYYGILKVTSDATTQLGFTELQPSNVILQGAATNQVRFDCIGNVLSLYVNGQQIDRQTDSTYSSGNVGLIAGTYDTAGADILFDNFTVLKP